MTIDDKNNGTSDVNWKNRRPKGEEDPSNNTRSIGNDWWNQKPSDAISVISSNLSYWRINQQPRMIQWAISGKLYANTTVLSVPGYVQPQPADRGNSTSAPVTSNVVQSCVDTLVSKICKNKPFPEVVSSMGDYKQQRKSKNLSTFLTGVFLENDAYEIGQRCIKDAAIFGIGAARIYTNEIGRVCIERVIPHEIWVDELAGVYGQGLNSNIGPRELHRCKTVDRSILLACFPENAKDIQDSPGIQSSDSRIPTVTDLLVVRESWHLPSIEGGKDGRYIISTETAVLRDEPYTRQVYPFAFVQKESRTFGFWGMGVPEQIQSKQLEINKISWSITRSHQLGGTYKILMPMGSKISDTSFDNKIGTVIQYQGEAPTYITPPIVQPELYEFRKELINECYQDVGISQLSSQSLKPNGLDSGKALRTMVDIESDRFTSFEQNYERFFVTMGKLCIHAIQDSKGQKGSYKVKAFNNTSIRMRGSKDKHLQSLDWKDISLPEDEFHIQIFPISFQTKSVEDRLEDVQEYMQAGLIDPAQGRRLLDFPDIDAAESLNNAQEDHILKIMDQIVDGDGSLNTYEAPEETDDLELMRKVALEYYTKYRDLGLEPEKLSLIRRFLAQIQDIENDAQAALQANQAAQAPAQPQANPQAPPVSPLVQNVPGIPQPQ